jgi:hypothetical protein
VQESSPEASVDSTSNPNPALNLPPPINASTSNEANAKESLSHGNNTPSAFTRSEGGEAQEQPSARDKSDKDKLGNGDIGGCLRVCLFFLFVFFFLFFVCLFFCWVLFLGFFLLLFCVLNLLHSRF